MLRVYPKTLTVEVVIRDYVSVSVAQKTLYGVSRQRYEQLVREGTVRGVKIHHALFVHRDDVQSHRDGQLARNARWTGDLSHPFTQAAAAVLLGLDRKTIETQIRRGIISKVPLSTPPLIREGELRRYQAEHQGRVGRPRNLRATQNQAKQEKG